MMKREEYFSETESVVETEQENTTEFPTVIASEPDEAVLLSNPKPTHQKKKRGLFGRSKTKVMEQKVEDEVTQPITEDEPVKVFGDETNGDTRELSVSQQTRVISDEEDEEENADATQLMLDGFDNTSDIEEGRAEALRRIRQEKIHDFSQKREEHERAEAEQENLEVVPEESEVVYPDQLEEPELPAAEPTEEYVTPQQLSGLRQSLVKTQRRSIITLLITAIVELILFVIAAVSFASPALAMSPITYLVLQLVFFFVMVFSSRETLGEGLSKLFSKTVTVESGIALATIVTVVHTALQFLDTAGVAEGTTPILTAVTGFALLLLRVAEKCEADRRLKLFPSVAAQNEILVAKRIEDSVLAEEIGRPAVAMGEPRVTYFRRATRVTDFARQTEDKDSGNALMRWYLPVSLTVSFLCAVAYLLINGLTAWMPAITAFCLVLCISVPASLLLYRRASLAITAKYLKKTGAVIFGYPVINEYGASDAVALDAIDLFPENSVLLHGIKTFSGTRIDEAILDAASVSVRAGGPLSHVFRRMIVNKVDMLHEVDTLVYEQDMGLSGWVGGRRVLIGNRKLLDNHGIDIPSKDYEERYAKNGRQLVYLSIAGEVSAMFVISYMADPYVKEILTELTARRVTLLVRTCDPNITESLISSTFGLDGFYVELLGAPAGRSYEGLTDGVTEREPASLVSTRDVYGMMGAVSQCRRLRTGNTFMNVCQAILGISGMLLVAYTALLAGVHLPTLYALEFLSVSALVTVLISWLFGRR